MQIYRGRQEKKALDFQAHQSEEDAVAEREAASLKAKKIKRGGESQQSQAIADLAASGVSVGSGTAVRIAGEIASDAAEDEMQTLLYGSRRASRFEEEAGFRRSAGRRAQTGGYLNAASSLLSTGAQSNWNQNRRNRINENRINE